MKIKAIIWCMCKFFIGRHRPIIERTDSSELLVNLL